MASEIGRINVTAVVEPWESRLVEQAAQRQAKYYPSKTPAKLVEDILAQLSAEKAARLRLNLNHWSEHAPQFLERIIEASRQDYLQRRRDVRMLLKTQHAHIVRVLKSIVGDHATAESIAADTYKELIDGQTRSPDFLSSAIRNAQNYLQKQSNEQEKIVPLDRAFAASRGDSEASDDVFTFEPTSQRTEDQDPLEILIQREERQEADAIVLAGMRDPRWRYIKRLDWAKELAEAFQPLAEKEASREISPV